MYKFNTKKTGNFEAETVKQAIEIMTQAGCGVTAWVYDLNAYSDKKNTMACTWTFGSLKQAEKSGEFAA